MKISSCSIIFLLTYSLMGCGGGGSSSDNTGADSTTLPPDPGDDGKITLTGIDSDSDGLRDDVQIAIHERFPNDDQKRSALTQKAKAIQDAVIAGDSSNPTSMNEASKSVINAVDCLHEKMDDPTSEIGFIEDKVINTSDRSQAYIKFNDSLSGQFFGGDDTESPCK